MASISSNGTGGGLASATTTWAGGVVPGLNDKVTIVGNDTVTFDLSPFVITNAGTAYTSAPSVALGGATGSGATAVAVMSNADGSGTVIGIKVITPGSGYTTPTVTFSGGSPSVAATATATVYNGRFCYMWGDDTTTAVNINSGATLKWSRSVTTALGLYGHLILKNGGTFDLGTSADPITGTGAAHSIFMNDSAALAAVKYGIECETGANNFYIFGGTRTVNTYLTSQAASGQANLSLNDVTGWRVGDRIWLAPTTNVATQNEERTITAISGTTVTVSSNLTNTHAANGRVGMCDHNILISSVTIGAATYYPGYVWIPYSNTTSANSKEIQYCTFEQGGDPNTTNKYAALALQTSGLTTLSVNPLKKIAFCSFRNGNTTTTNCYGLIVRVMFVTATIEDCAFYSTSTSGYPLGIRNGSNVTMTRCVIYKSVVSSYVASFEQGSIGSTFSSCYFLGCSNSAVRHDTGTATFNDCYFDCSTTAFSGANFSYSVFNRCQVGNTFGGFSSATAHMTFSLGALVNWKFTDCTFGTTPSTIVGTTTYATTSSTSRIILENKNVDPSVQEIYTPNGTIVRDNTSKISGVTSLKVSPTNSSSALTFTLNVPAPTGKVVGVSGYLYRDTSNTATVTLSGLGITTSTYTASGALNANEQFFVSGTQTTGTDGFLVLTISVTGSSGNMWVDAISAPQASAIDFGEFGYWTGGLPADVVSANFVAASDVWNTQMANITTSGSIGVATKQTALIPALL